MRQILCIIGLSLMLIVGGCVSASRQIGDATTRVTQHLAQAHEATGKALQEIRLGRDASSEPAVVGHLNKAEKHSETSRRHTSGAISDVDRVVQNLSGIEDKPSGLQVILRYLFFIAIIGGTIYLLERLQIFTVIRWSTSAIRAFAGRGRA